MFLDASCHKPNQRKLIPAIKFLGGKKKKKDKAFLRKTFCHMLIFTDILWIV